MVTFNPVLDEQTATTLCILIHNQIEALKVWERKLRDPYLPANNKVTYVYRRHPDYPKPTLSTALQVALSGTHFDAELLRVVRYFAQAERLKLEA